MDPLLKLLTKLREIEPDSIFRHRTRMSILNAPQRRHRIWIRKFNELFQYSSALVMASFLILVVLGGVAIFNTKILSPAISSSLDTDKLHQELANMDLRIKLSEAQYYEDSFRKVTVALNEASKNGPGHLNPDVLQEEMQTLEVMDAKNRNIEELLDELML